VFETEARKTFGPNWKNILAGMGEHYPCKPDIFAMTYEPVEAGKENDNGQ
jgi:hypothetical protein